MVRFTYHFEEELPSRSSHCIGVGIILMHTRSGSPRSRTAFEWTLMEWSGSMSGSEQEEEEGGKVEEDEPEPALYSCGVV